MLCRRKLIKRGCSIPYANVTTTEIWHMQDMVNDEKSVKAYLGVSVESSDWRNSLVKTAEGRTTDLEDYITDTFGLFADGGYRHFARRRFLLKARFRVCSLPQFRTNIVSIGTYLGNSLEITSRVQPLF